MAALGSAMMRFEPERFVLACRAAIAATEATAAIRELVTEAVREPASVATALGEPPHAGIVTLYRGPELTVLDLAWAPWMPFKPHNHAMWSVIGVYAGREDNIFYRRVGGGARVEAAGARTLGEGDAALFGHDLIHSVVNPLGRMTRAIQIYGGDFFAPATPRSEWDPETLIERPWDLEDARQRFASAEARAAVTA
jgi:predicted metal-dependent enzyme (double-stranded beta helix superfamily)